MGLDEGLFLSSNICDFKRKPVFAEEVAALSEREKE